MPKESNTNLPPTTMPTPLLSAVVAFAEPTSITRVIEEVFDKPDDPISKTGTDGMGRVIF
jgi:hypothetical protein